MSPYRSTPTRNPAHQLRLAEPLPAAGLVLVGIVFAPPLAAMCEAESALGVSLVAVFAALVASLVLLFRHRAWIVLMPREERVRVVRLRAFSYSATTLRLSDAMSVECLPVGRAMWLFVVAKDGRAARVIPAASARMIERVQTALEDAV